MSNIHYISSKPLTLAKIKEIVDNNYSLALSDEAEQKIISCREYLDQKLKSQESPIYGINTGFGALHNIKISKTQLAELQENLVMSHACGTGDKVPVPIIRLMLLLKIQSLSYGHSGVSLQTVTRLIDFYNNKVYPVVYTLGSLGASGDLAPLAHLSLPLLGKGEVYFNNTIIKSEDVLEQFGWQPIKLQSKEGLALLNGTQFMSAYGTYMLLYSERLSYLADLIGALSLEAFDGRIEPFSHLIHEIRPHKGQIETAKNISSFLNGSELINQPKAHVQDPYSFRCIPQVHGATKDAIQYVKQTVTTEINSVTDNPNVFKDEDVILSGGNFHGQTLALAFDFLGIAIAELGNISERRIFQLLSGNRNLPAFLVDDPGLHSGLMIPQYTAAGIVSQNKQLATPASVDSIVSSNGQEDHVSMGANAATKCLKILENVECVLAIELITASQAIRYRRPLKTSETLEQLIANFREKVPFIDKDRVLHVDIENAISFIKKLPIDELKR